jgi:hypothetical protein
MKGRSLSVPGGIVAGMTMDDIAGDVHAALSAEIADRWIAMLRPGLRLRPAAPGETVVCRLGGNPRLPEAAAWPEWPEHGPLTFVAEVECAALPRDELDLAFPAEGSLLFFYFDGQFDGGDALVLGADISSLLGGRVLYVEPGADVAERSAPDGIEPYSCQHLAGDIVLTAPDFSHPEAAWMFHGPGTEATFAREFTEDVHALHSPGHQIAGHARPVQGAVEHEVATPVVTSATGPGGVSAPAHEWRLLAQVVSDGRSKMMWGDFGTLYWLITAEDLAARRFDRARMTWQCH